MTLALLRGLFLFVSGVLSLLAGGAHLSTTVRERAPGLAERRRWLFGLAVASLLAFAVTDVLATGPVADLVLPDGALAERLVPDLLSDDSAVRAAAVARFSRLGEPAVPVLLGAMAEGEARLRSSVTDAALAVPSGLLGGEGPDLSRVRREAAALNAVTDALGAVGAPAAAPLVAVLRSRVIHGEPPLAPGPLGWLDRAIAFASALLADHAAYTALVKVGPPAVPELRVLAADGDPRLRATAAEALGEIGAPQADVSAALRDLAADPDPAVRAAAAAAIRRSGAWAGP